MPDGWKTARELEEAGKGPLPGESEAERLMRLHDDACREAGMIQHPVTKKWINPLRLGDVGETPPAINNAIRPGRRV